MPRKTCATLLAFAALAAAPALPSASAASTETSSNWAGYAVRRSGVKFRHVTATWTQRAVDCTTSAGSSYSAYWVGLGGLSQSSQALEQIGTDADCSSTGATKYIAWYELVPQASVDIGSITVRPGDRMSASVDVRGTTVKLRLENLTRGRLFSRTLRAAQVDTGSAEWIVEAPSLCDTQLQFCETQPLADFGTAKFANAKATTTGGHVGAIADPAWSATAINLSTAGGGLGPSRFARDRGTSATATASGLAASGSSFTVTYGSTTSQTQQNGSVGQMPGGFQGGPPPPGAFSG